MTDKLTRRATAQRVAQEQEAMAAWAMALQKEVQRFCADIIQGGPYAGRAQAIASDAIELAMKAASFDAASDVAAIAVRGVR